jgi:hypothetical protein
MQGHKHEVRAIAGQPLYQVRPYVDRQHVMPEARQGIFHTGSGLQGNLALE